MKKLTREEVFEELKKILPGFREAIATYSIIKAIQQKDLKPLELVLNSELDLRQFFKFGALLENLAEYVPERFNEFAGRLDIKQRDLDRALSIAVCFQRLNAAVFLFDLGAKLAKEDFESFSFLKAEDFENFLRLRPQALYDNEEILKAAFNKKRYDILEVFYKFSNIDLKECPKSKFRKEKPWLILQKSLEEIYLAQSGLNSSDPDVYNDAGQTIYDAVQGCLSIDKYHPKLEEGFKEIIGVLKGLGISKDSEIEDDLMNHLKKLKREALVIKKRKI